MAKKQSRRSISVSRATYERLKSFCETNQISMSQFVEHRVGDYLGRSFKRDDRASETRIPSAQHAGAPRDAGSAAARVNPRSSSAAPSRPTSAVAAAPAPVVQPAPVAAAAAPKAPATVTSASAPASRPSAAPAPATPMRRGNPPAPAPAKRTADQIFTF